MDNNTLIETYGNQDLLVGTMDRPLVTFSVFAYNQEQYIREAEEGAFSQNYWPLKIFSVSGSIKILGESIKAQNSLGVANYLWVN